MQHPVRNISQPINISYKNKIMASRTGLQADWFSFGGVSAPNEKIKILCVLCASAVSFFTDFQA